VDKLVGKCRGRRFEGWERMLLKKLINNVEYKERGIQLMIE
jgi:hypothetical protein